MTALFQQLPSVDKLLKTAQGTELLAEFGHSAVVDASRRCLQQAREFIKQQKNLPHFCLSETAFLTYLESILRQQRGVAMKPVHNLTGTVLHTNLGRAVWSHSAQNAALSAMSSAVALEFDLAEGKRGHRDTVISDVISRLTGAEAACVVNNNAAAVLLMLATFAKDKEVVISRGELIEIGGAFRIPDIMAQAGCKLVEVGTTNRTHLKDYRNAINENTAFLMKVHTSNYQISGFTASVEEQALVELGKEFGIPVISDLGSGALVDLTQYGLPKEPTVQEKLAQGVDLISFSGDKLLGAAQAGIIVGKKQWIERLQQHPLKRVLRCDKVILAGLEATLRLYLEPENLTRSLPVLNALTKSLADLEQSAVEISAVLQRKLGTRFDIQIEPGVAQIGSGAQPNEHIASVAVTLQSKTEEKTTALLARLKALATPVIGRMENDKIWLDMRSAGDISALLATLETL